MPSSAVMPLSLEDWSELKPTGSHASKKSSQLDGVGSLVVDVGTKGAANGGTSVDGDCVVGVATGTSAFAVVDFVDVGTNSKIGTDGIGFGVGDMDCGNVK